MKKITKLMSLVSIVIVFTIALTGCGLGSILGAGKAEARAEELLAEFNQIPSPDTITEPLEYVESYEQFLDILVELYDLSDKYPDNEVISSARYDVFNQQNDWSSNSIGMVKEIAGDSELSDRLMDCMDKSIGIIDREEALLEKKLEEIE